MERPTKAEIFQLLTGLTQSDAWQMLIRPALKSRISELSNIIVDGEQRIDGKVVPLSREEERDIRQLIKALNWLLDWENVLEKLTREIEASLSAKPKRRPPAYGSLYAFPPEDEEDDV